MISQRTARQSLYLITSNILKLGTGFASTILVARVLGPGSFGTFSLLINFVLTISALSDFGLNISFVRLYGKKNVDDLISSVGFLQGMLSLRILLSLLFFLICFFLLPIFGGILIGGSVSAGLIKIGCLIVLFDGVFNFLLAMLQAEEKFEKYSLINCIPNLVKVVLWGSFFFLHKLNIETALLIFVVSMAAGGLIGFITEPLYRIVIDIRETLKSLVDVFFWSRWILIQTVANTIFVKLDLLMLGYFKINSGEIGNYSFALAFANLITVAQTTMITLLLPKISVLKTSTAIEAYLRKSMKLILFFVLVLSILIPLATVAIKQIYQHQYPDASIIFLIISLAFSYSLIITPITLLSFTLDRPQIPAWENIFGILVLIVLNSWLVPHYGIIGAAYAVLLSRIIVESIAGVVVLLFFRRKHSLALFS